MHGGLVFTLAQLLILVTPFAHADSIKISGKLMECPNVAIRTDHNAPGPGFLRDSDDPSEQKVIIINPNEMNEMPKMARWFMFNHECAHSYVGRNEKKADIEAVNRSVKQGWLNAEAVKQVCADFEGQPADGEHPSGNRRCEYITERFQELTAKNVSTEVAASNEEVKSEETKPKSDEAPPAPLYTEKKLVKYYHPDPNQKEQCGFVTHSEETKIIRLIKTRWIKDGKELSESEIDKLSSEEFQKALTVPVLTLVRHGKKISLTGFSSYSSAGHSKISAEQRDRKIMIDSATIDFAYFYVNGKNVGTMLGCKHDQPESLLKKN